MRHIKRGVAKIQAQRDIERLLFETGAIRIAPENKPFWYTSGTIGPYYSNTQNLIGSELEADKLLKIIDAAQEGEKTLLPAKIERYFYDAYINNGGYHIVSDYIKAYIYDNMDIADIDVVSGGARRDWFFSFIAARMINKPHLTIFKDGCMVLSEPYTDAAAAAGASEAAGTPAGTPVADNGLLGKRCLHVSDIITEASSYARSWAPAVARAGARIHASLTILDRLQGGEAVLASLGIKHFTLAKLDADFFDRALKQGHINGAQHIRLRAYIADPHGSMRTFLKERPEFLQDALSAGGKEAERARMCVESGVYGADITLAI